jgi:2-polyprenyl-3-methyl-5-hydroxy-6-metoxy-1,4-benzoquinol methylase
LPVDVEEIRPMNACPACLSASLRQLRVNAWSEKGEVYSLVGCPACGCTASWPIPSAEALARHYRETFNYAWYRDHLPAKYVDAKRRLLEVKPWLGRRILDFGGGLGYLSRAARKLGYDSATVDPYQGTGTAGETGWDTVFALHVLEHVPDPAATLAQLHGLLEPGGTMILAVPNALGAGYRRIGGNWPWFQAPITHIFHFTPQALARLVARSGFELLGLSFHDRWDANTVADIERSAETRRLDAEWHETEDTASRPALAWRTFRRRYRALAACPDPAQDNADLAEILVIARKS